MVSETDAVARLADARSGKSGTMAIATARDAADLLGPLFAEGSGETLAVLHLDAERRPIAVEERSWPGDRIDLSLRDIFKAALNHNAAGLVIAHSHPSGNPQPSRADIEATRRLAETAANLGITLYDHLVFAGGECRSFREMRLL